MSIYLHYLHHKMGLGTAEIYRCYPQYPKTTLYWHMKQDAEVDVEDSCHKNSGRRRKTTVCDCRKIIGTLQSLRRSVDTFSFRYIQEAVDMNATILNNYQTCPA